MQYLQTTSITFTFFKAWLLVEVILLLLESFYCSSKLNYSPNMSVWIYQRKVEGLFNGTLLCNWSPNTAFVSNDTFGDFSQSDKAPQSSKLIGRRARKYIIAILAYLSVELSFVCKISLSVIGKTRTKNGR